MMVLSRLWYVVLALLLGVCTYVVFLAVGEYDRRNGVAMEEELASDSQTVGWALTIDARKRLDALLIGAVDKGVQDSLQAATGKDTIPIKSKDDGRRALNATLEKIPADFRPDAIFEVDHDGRMVSQVGFDPAAAFQDFELGGYPAVFDALHGYLRDDTWVLGGQAYRVVARPVEVDATQPPVGAIVALKAVDKKFAQDISTLTRANVAFFAGGRRVATAVPGFDELKMSAIDSDMASLASDKSYADGRSTLHQVGDGIGAIYARFVGDAWDLNSGFVVVRSRTSIGGPMGFLSGADEKDKKSVNLVLVGAVVLIALGIGMALSVLEHSLPLRQMVKQGGSLRRGQLDYLQVAKFRGAYRGIAEDVNAGIDRLLERGGGAVRKPADLESILGPVPAQPSMSAFSFPLAEEAPAARGSQGSFPGPSSSPGVVPPLPPPPGPPPPRPRPPAPSAPAILAAPPAMAPRGSSPQFPQPRGSSPEFGAPRHLPPPVVPPQGRPAPYHAAPGNTRDLIDGDGPTMALPSPGAAPPPAQALTMDATLASPGVERKKGPPEAGIKLGMGVPSVPGAGAGVGSGSGTPLATHTMMGIGLQAKAAAGAAQGDGEDDESTVIARAPSELLEAARVNDRAAADETAEWMGVYDEFLRTKKQCQEPSDGLSFEKFQNTLRKNRDALVERHHCKRVRFSVYIKDGRASLKATPVKE
jgi:hypothetical protein